MKNGDRIVQAKPAVILKSKQYASKMKKREYALAMIELAYDYKCNLSCSHCYAHRLGGKGKKLTVSDLASLSYEAHELGVFQFNLQGGEPLMWEGLDDIIKALRPELFHIAVTTNATLLDYEMAKWLRALGVDKISVSLDSIDEEMNDDIRNCKGLYRKTVDALQSAKKAGLHVNINSVITHANVRSEETIRIAEYAQHNGFTVLFIAAVPIGKWEGRRDILITESDARHLLDIARKYPAVRRDVYPAYGIDYGCRTMNGLVYITENGDLLACPFIHISIGNILEEPLAKILERGWKVKHFRDYNSKCLAAEDVYFIDCVLSKTYGRNVPIPFKKAFSDPDLY